MKLRSMLTCSKEPEVLLQSFSERATKSLLCTVGCFVAFSGKSDCFTFFMDHFGNMHTPHGWHPISSITEDNTVLSHCKQVELYGMGETKHTATINRFG